MSSQCCCSSCLHYTPEKYLLSSHAVLQGTSDIEKPAFKAQLSRKRFNTKVTQHYHQDTLVPASQGIAVDITIGFMNYASFLNM